MTVTPIGGGVQCNLREKIGLVHVHCIGKKLLFFQLKDVIFPFARVVSRLFRRLLSSIT